MGVVVVKTIEEWVIGRWRRPFRIWCKFRGIKLWRSNSGFGGQKGFGNANGGTKEFGNTSGGAKGIGNTATKGSGNTSGGTKGFGNTSSTFKSGGWL
jgi:hypothetical protein